jgi:hypothetical protein
MAKILIPFVGLCAYIVWFRPTPPPEQQVSRIYPSIPTRLEDITVSERNRDQPNTEQGAFQPYDAFEADLAHIVLMRLTGGGRTQLRVG